MKAICTVAGCASSVRALGLCNLHYKRYKKHGDPTVRLIRENGEGTPHISGYWHIKKNGVTKLRHVWKAEAAIGRELPQGAEVHHVDYDRGNDSNSNLVICPDRSYHRLLHRRTNALLACGNANWLKCWLCQKHGPPEEMRAVNKTFAHHGCQKKYQNDGYHRRLSEAA